MASIMQRIFGSQPQQTMAVQQPAANPAVIAKQPTEQSANGPAEPVSPQLDPFKDIWQTPATDPNSDPFSTPLLTVDPQKIQEAVGKMDFLSGMPNDLLTKATSGDAGAFTQVVNTAIQKALAAQVQLSTQMTEGAITKNNERHLTALPGRIREAQVKDVRSSNPVLNHPAAAPMLDSLKRNIMQRQPKLSPIEVHQQAEDMLTAFGSALTGEQQQKEKPTGRDPSDFSHWG